MGRDVGTLEQGEMCRRERISQIWETPRREENRQKSSIKEKMLLIYSSCRGLVCAWPKLDEDPKVSPQSGEGRKVQTPGQGEMLRLPGAQGR